MNNRELVPFDDEGVVEFNDGWTYQDREGKLHEITLPINTDTHAGEPIRIMRTVPREIQYPDVLCFRSSQQSVRVTFDGKEIYTFAKNSNFRYFGKSLGSAWNIVRLPNRCAGGTVSIEMTSPYEDYSGYMGKVMIGTKSALLFYILRAYLPSFMATTLIFIAGIMMLILYYVLVRKNEHSREMLYLGCFSILVSMWMFGETRMVQFFIGNTFGSMCMTFMCLLLFLIPLIKCVCCTKNFRYKRLLKSMAMILYIQTIVVCALQLFDIFDFIEMVCVIHTVLISVAIICFIAVIFDWIHNHNTNIRTLSISLFILCIFAILEIISFYRLDGRNIGILLRIGVFFFIAIQMRLAVKKALQIVRLSKIATVDALTGCQNRTAYIHKLEMVRERNDIAAVMVDLNNLKTINDTMGHEVGDDALLHCSDCFSRAFSRFGTCYRMGGDEFLFLGFIADIEHLDTLEKNFEELCLKESVNLPYVFEVASGGVIFDEELDTCVEDTVRRADHMMYVKKQKMKADKLP